MTIINWVALSVSLLALVVSGASVAITLAGRPDRKARNAVAQLELDIEDIFERVKSLHGRKAVAARREKEAEKGEWSQRADETTDQWKSRVRARMRGGSKPPGEGA